MMTIGGLVLFALAVTAAFMVGVALSLYQCNDVQIKRGGMPLYGTQRQILRELWQYLLAAIIATMLGTFFIWSAR